MQYTAAKAFILSKLETELAQELTYHGLHHTIDVLAVTEELCQLENISAYETDLLKTAALFHDAGFLVSNIEHEAHGCALSREYLPSFGYTDTEIERICAMIMATKIPQSPNNHLETILCDADLDYLGRKDFYPIAASLFKELKGFNIVQDEYAWDQIQVRFLQQHAYFTATNKERRTSQKMQYLAELKGKLAESEG